MAERQTAMPSYHHPLAPLLEGAAYTLAEYFWLHARFMSPFYQRLANEPMGPVTRTQLERALAHDDRPAMEARVRESEEHLKALYLKRDAEWQAEFDQRRTASLEARAEAAATSARRLTALRAMLAEAEDMPRPPSAPAGLDLKETLIAELRAEIDSQVRSAEGNKVDDGSYESMPRYRSILLRGAQRRVGEEYAAMDRVVQDQDAARVWMRGLAAAVPPPE